MSAPLPPPSFPPPPREVQKALSRARALFDRWEELLQDGTQVSFPPHTEQEELLTADT